MLKNCFFNYTDIAKALKPPYSVRNCVGINVRFWMTVATQKWNNYRIAVEGTVSDK